MLFSTIAHLVFIVAIDLLCILDDSGSLSNISSSAISDNIIIAAGAILSVSD
jgi:hypothetical protein